MTGANDNRWQRRIYIASCTRNPEVTSLTASLREEGHPVFDFSAEKQPPAWAAWNNREPDGCPRQVSFQRMVDLPEDEESPRTFDRDMTALQEAAASAWILSCSQSAHLEPEYAIAPGQRTIMMYDEPEEPDLGRRAAAYLGQGTGGVIAALRDRPALNKEGTEAPEPPGARTKKGRLPAAPPGKTPYDH